MQADSVASTANNLTWSNVSGTVIVSPLWLRTISALAGLGRRNITRVGLDIRRLPVMLPDHKRCVIAVVRVQESLSLIHI